MFKEILVKRTRQILQLTYNNGQSVPVNGKEICLPNQAAIVAVTSCSYQEIKRIIAGTNSYRSELDASVSVSGGVGKLINAQYIECMLAHSIVHFHCTSHLLLFL